MKRKQLHVKSDDICVKIYQHLTSDTNIAVRKPRPLATTCEYFKLFTETNYSNGTPFYTEECVELTAPPEDFPNNYILLFKSERWVD